MLLPAKALDLCGDMLYKWFEESAPDITDLYCTAGGFMGLRISLAQMDISLGKPDENLAKARSMTVLAAERGSDAIVFPELWSTGYDLENAIEHSTPMDKGVFADMSSLAREYNIHVTGSCLSLLGPGRSFGPD